jgi:drug/metabolite transporter (DMT)-like permease
VSFGLVFGLTAALCWGVADFFARGATRSGGIFGTLLSMQGIATVALLAVATPLGLLHLANLDPRLTLIAALLNLVILAGTAMLYRAFAIGTLAIVSPIAASYAAVTALLAIVLSHERPHLPQLIGIATTLGGVILVSAVSSATPDHHHADLPSPPGGDTTARVRKAPRSLAPGLPEALISTLIFGIAYWALRFVVAGLGGVTVAFIGKASDLIVLLVIALAAALLPRLKPRRATVAPALPSPSIQPAGRRWRVFLMTVIPTALFDTAANIAYNLGISGNLTSIVAVLSSLFGAVTVLLAWIFLRERLSLWQWAGVITIFLGIVLVSM